MQVLTRPAVQARLNVLSKIRTYAASMVAALAVMLVVTPSTANASTGLLGGAETSFFSTITTFFTGSLLPLVFVLAAVVIGASLLIKYGRKAVSS